MSFVKDIIETKHPIYISNVNYWDFLLQSYEGGKDYTNAFVSGNTAQTSLKDYMFRVFIQGKEQVQNIQQSNLFRHPKERTEDYNERMRMSFYYNFCAPIIDIYTNHLFKDSVVTDFGDIENTVEEISENFDLKNSSIEEFRRELAESCQIYGHSFVVIDSPNISEDLIITRQDQIERRAFPYGTIYPPQAVINWSLDETGAPYWVMLVECAPSNQDFRTYNKNATVNWNYKLWTRDEWYLYDKDYNEIAKGVHGLGVVPIICVFDKKSRKAVNFLGVSSLADISFIARDIYNSCSELKQILRDQTFAFLAIQGTSTEYDELSVGTSKAILYPEGRSVPQYVSPPPTNAEVYFNHIDRQVRKIYQLAKLEGGSATQEQSAIQQTGVSKAWDFNETNTALAKKALNMEDAETKVWGLIALWEGKEFDGRIQYANEFSVSSFMDDLVEAEKAGRLALGETFDLEIRKAIHKKKFPRASEEDLAKMEREAKAKLGQAGDVSPMANRLRGLFNNANSGGNGGLKNE